MTTDLTETDIAAHVAKYGTATVQRVLTDGRVEVVFGRNERAEWGGVEFIVAHYPKPRTYATRARADKAAASWLASEAARA